MGAFGCSRAPMSSIVRVFSFVARDELMVGGEQP
jgi:hypothetical protein